MYICVYLFIIIMLSLKPIIEFFWITDELIMNDSNVCLFFSNPTAHHYNSGNPQAIRTSSDTTSMASANYAAASCGYPTSSKHHNNDRIMEDCEFDGYLLFGAAMFFIDIVNLSVFPCQSKRHK